MFWWSEVEVWWSEVEAWWREVEQYSEGLHGYVQSNSASVIKLWMVECDVGGCV